MMDDKKEIIETLEKTLITLERFDRDCDVTDDDLYTEISDLLKRVRGE